MHTGTRKRISTRFLFFCFFRHAGRRELARVLLFHLGNRGKEPAHRCENRPERYQIRDVALWNARRRYQRTVERFRIIIYCLPRAIHYRQYYIIIIGHLHIIYYMITWYVYSAAPRLYTHLSSAVTIILRGTCSFYFFFSPLFPVTEEFCRPPFENVLIFYVSLLRNILPIIQSYFFFNNISHIVSSRILVFAEVNDDRYYKPYNRGKIMEKHALLRDM